MQEEETVEVVEPQEISVEDSIRAAIEEVEKSEEPKEIEEKQPKEVSSKEPKEKVVEKSDKPYENVEKDPKIQAPQSWSGAVKQKWADLPEDVQAEIAKRENDVHQMMTRHDGELRLGRELKDVITPYMAQIQAEGGTPARAVQSLLNTAYQLRTAGPAQKVALLHQIAQEYNIDINAVSQQPQQYVDPYVAQLEQKINQFEQKINEQSTLQERMEHDRIMDEVNAFAADPKNIYFEQVKAAMAPLLGSNQAKDMQEAYEMACWANPSIRSSLMQAQANEQAEKKKQEMVKKKQASASITGSPGIKSQNSTTPKRTIEEELASVFDDIVGSKI